MAGSSALYVLTAGFWRYDVTGENWHQERDRLIKLLAGVEAGKITHVDADDQRQLQSTNVANVEMLKKRLAELNARLAPNSDVGT